MIVSPWIKTRVVMEISVAKTSPRLEIFETADLNTLILSVNISVGSDSVLITGLTSATNYTVDLVADYKGTSSYTMDTDTFTTL